MAEIVINPQGRGWDEEDRKELSVRHKVGVGERLGEVLSRHFSPEHQKTPFQSIIGEDYYLDLENIWWLDMSREDFVQGQGFHGPQPYQLGLSIKDRQQPNLAEMTLVESADVGVNTRRFSDEISRSIEAGSDNMRVNVMCKQFPDPYDATNEAEGALKFSRLGRRVLTYIYPPTSDAFEVDSNKLDPRSTEKAITVTLLEEDLKPASYYGNILDDGLPIFEGILDELRFAHEEELIHGDTFLRNFGVEEVPGGVEIVVMDLESYYDFRDDPESPFYEERMRSYSSGVVHKNLEQSQVRLYNNPDYVAQLQDNAPKDRDHAMMKSLLFKAAMSRDVDRLLGSLSTDQLRGGDFDSTWAAIRGRYIDPLVAAGTFTAEETIQEEDFWNIWQAKLNSDT